MDAELAEAIAQLLELPFGEFGRVQTAIAFPRRQGARATKGRSWCGFGAGGEKAIARRRWREPHFPSSESRIPRSRDRKV